MKIGINVQLNGILEKNWKALMDMPERNISFGRRRSEEIS